MKRLGRTKSPKRETTRLAAEKIGEKKGKGEAKATAAWKLHLGKSIGIDGKMEIGCARKNIAEAITSQVMGAATSVVKMGKVLHDSGHVCILVGACASLAALVLIRTLTWSRFSKMNSNGQGTTIRGTNITKKR